MLPILRRSWRKPPWVISSRCRSSDSAASSSSRIPHSPAILTHNQVRQSFIDYFVHSHGHQFIRSSPVKPSTTDQSLLFVNAGMNQFKPIFLDQLDNAENNNNHLEHFRALKRAVNSQKCIRVGGKHCDLENVGVDFTHHTFFEMLGNWSFNDYFKKEACQQAWNLLTTVYNLDPARLVVTIFGGDQALGLSPDLEAFEIWRSIGVPAHRIVPLGMADNFWEMGETGPCGICTELHYQRLPVDLQPDDPGYQKALEAACFEIWNIVFIQYFRDADGKLHRLGKNYVDTGMGLERVLALVQGVENNYETDLFTPYFERIEKLCKWPSYTGELSNPKDIAYRILADHTRMAAISIADGIEPDDRGAGYLLRRVLRRAIDSIRRVCELHGSLPDGVTESVMLTSLAEVAVDSLGSAFPELQDRSDQIRRVIEDEVRLYTTALLRNVHLMKLGESLKIKLGADPAVNGRQIEGKIEEVSRSVAACLVESEAGRPKVNQAEVDQLRREYCQLVELSMADESISGRFGLTSTVIRERLSQLDLDLVQLESRVDRILQDVIAQFEVESKRCLEQCGGGQSPASMLALSNQSINARSVDFFLLKAAADLYGTDRPLAVFLKQQSQSEEQASVEAFLLQLTVPAEYHGQLEAGTWFERAVDRMNPEIKSAMQAFPMKNKRVKRTVRFRVKLTEDGVSNMELDSVEKELRRAVVQVAEGAFTALE